MSRTLVLASMGLLLATLGCSQSSPVASSAQIERPAPEALSSGPTVIGRYTLEVDPVTLSAKVLTPRLAQDNDGVYLLPIDAFLTPAKISIQFLELGASTLDISYRFAHPFAASGTSNRADLGVSGFLLFLTDVAGANGNRYFTGSDDVVANTATIANADAYYQPRGLLDTSAMTANTFPYKLLVDESLNNRFDGVTGAPISNGGDPMGNFIAPNGWQTGGSETWTGYGVLHQGQAADNVLSVNRAVIEGGGRFSLDFAVIVKYNDPRSGTPARFHRLPSDPADLLTGFGYRMPHGALDVETLRKQGSDPVFLADAEGSRTLGFHVRDWDARATEAAGTLADDPDATHVTAGASGPPALSVCAPEIAGDDTVTVDFGSVPSDDDSPQGGDQEPDSGRPNDELFYAGSLPKVAGSSQVPGDYTAMVRAADVESGDEAYLVPLHGDLTPVLANRPVPVTYQTFTIRLSDGPTGWARQLSGNGSEEAFGVAVDSTGASYVIGWFDGTGDFGGTVRPASDLMDVFLVKFDSAGEYVWDRVWGGNGEDTGYSVAIDSLDNVWVIGTFSETVDFGGTPITSAGEADVFLVKLNPGGAHLASFGFGGPGEDVGYAIAIATFDYPTITGYFENSINFGGGAMASAGAYDVFAAGFFANGTYKWQNSYGSTGNDGGIAVRSYPADGSVAIGGGFEGTVNFGGGGRTSADLSDAFVLRLAGIDGAYMWDRTFGGPGFDNVQAVIADSASNVVVTGVFETSIDLGGGPLASAGDIDIFIGRLGPTGTHQWSDRYGTSGIDAPTDLAVDSAGNVFLTGWFPADLDFGGTPLVNGGGDDIFLVKFAGATGDHIWSQAFGGVAMTMAMRWPLNPVEKRCTRDSLRRPWISSPGPASASSMRSSRIRLSARSTPTATGSFSASRIRNPLHWRLPGHQFFVTHARLRKDLLRHVESQRIPAGREPDHAGGAAAGFDRGVGSRHHRER